VKGGFKIMKFNFKKISAIAISVLTVGLTFGVVNAASYPAPFVDGSTTDVAIVLGTGAGVSALDHIEATNIFSDLQSRTTGSSATDETITGGDARSMASGTDLLYLNDDLGENVQTLTKDDLGTVLADGTFTDDDGTTYDYEQTITIGNTNTYNEFEFGNSGNDFDDPQLMFEFEKASNPIYTTTLTFTKPCNLSASTSESEELVIFGKTYTIGTATDVDTLVLLGGAESTTVNVGETVSVTVEGVPYEVTLTGITDATTPVAAVTVNGESKTFTAGQTKTLGGVEVYVKTINRWSDNSGEIKIQIGADKLTFETGTNVVLGSDTDIEGTTVTLGSVGAFSTLSIAVYAEDNKVNHLLIGEEFVDPVFGTFKVDFVSVANAPIFTAEEDTSSSRTALSLSTGGSRELVVDMVDKYGNVCNGLPFSFEDVLQDDNSKAIEMWEGAAIAEDEYFILNSGNYEHFMQATKVNVANTPTTDDVWIKDLCTETTYKKDNSNFSVDGATLTINNQVYTIINTSATEFTITSSDVATNKAAFPYLELNAGEDLPRLAWTDVISPAWTTNASANATATDSLIYDLPTGTIYFSITDEATNQVGNTAVVTYVTTATGGTAAAATTIAALNCSDANPDLERLSISIGEVAYTFHLTALDAAADAGAELTVDNISIAMNYGTAELNPTNYQTSPGLLYIEDKDKSDADARNSIFFNTTTDSTYDELEDLDFSGTSGVQYDTQAWDETKLTGYLTNWGTYVLKDTTDTNQHVARLTYPSSQMYANVYFAEEGTIITPGSGGGTGDTFTGVVVMDTEVSSVATKNLVIVGGSCINQAAATLVGGGYCGQAWTDATGIEAGQFLIKGYTDNSLTSGLALLVAGYHAADTKNAATYLRTQAPDTESAWKGTTATTAESHTMPA
jgi:hypothetical protein